MPPGRPRKPTSAKLLAGTYRADRDGPLTAATCATGEPSPPDSLKGEERAFWDRIVPDLVARGVAAACDTPALVMMCEWWALYRRLRDSLPPEGTLGGCTQLVTQCAIATDKFSQAAARFGLNPSDRAKLNVAPPEPKPDGKARYFA